MGKTILGIVLIALLGQIAGAIDSSLREVRTSSAPTATQGSDSASGETTESLPYMIDVPQAAALYEAGDTVFADARPFDQFAEGHIAGAEHLDPEAFLGGAEPDFVYMYPPEQRIVIYCPGGECDASELVAIRLQNYGFTNLHILEPGYPGWVDAGLPTETGTGQP